jgi:hypothetical protein
VKIVGTSIYMTRGDSETITVSIRDSDGNDIPLAAGDTIYFTVKSSIEATEKAFQKVITNFTDGKAIINILPEDTKSLPFTELVYDVQWTSAAGKVTTIIKPSKFIIEGEVTYE